MKYDEAKKLTIASLNQAIEAHESGNYSRIDSGFDELDVALPRNNADERYDSLIISLSFWDSWIDARNHDWDYYPDFPKYSWPKHARIIVEDLNSERNISDELILKNFDFTRKTSFLGRMLTLSKRIFHLQ